MFLNLSALIKESISFQINVVPLQETCSSLIKKIQLKYKIFRKLCDFLYKKKLKRHYRKAKFRLISPLSTILLPAQASLCYEADLGHRS